MAARLLRVGLTGGIASGKSHVLRRLDAAGFATVDLDRIAHTVTARGGPAYARVVEAFGTGVLDDRGEVDRKALGAIVFASPQARARLDAIVHPVVRQQEAAVAREAQAAGARVLVTDAALLVEAGLHLRFDRLVVTWCPPAAQLARLRDRDGLDEGAARARVSSQMPGDEKRAFAHFVVDTSGSVAETDAQVADLVPRLRDLEPPAPLPLAPERVRACLARGPAAGPRGLSPGRLLEAVGEARGLDMRFLAALLEPKPEGPWYRAARPRESGPGPEALAGALAIACARRGADEPFVVVAASSLARLTHAEPGAQAGACLAAAAAWRVAREGSVAALSGSAVPLWAEQARARAGAGPPDHVIEQLRRAASGAGVAGSLSGALEGLAGAKEGP